MTKEDIYALLSRATIDFEITRHGAVYDMAAVDEGTFPYPDRIAKNLFLRDDKKANYYLLTVMGDKRLQLKDFGKNQGTRRLSFASKEEMEKYLKLTPGTVSPFGLLNLEYKSLIWFLDKDFLAGNGLIGVHPNDNHETVWLKTSDLMKVLDISVGDIHLVTV